jgi:fructokinase
LTLQSDEAKRPLIIGEVLFDCFPDRSVLGGAPFNVAWNLRGLGLNPLIITAVGDDILGEQVQQRMSEWGMDLSGLQICTGKPTGQVDIQLMDGHASYQFRDDVAFDHLLFPEGLDTDDNFGLLYHGSLALRCPDTYQTVLRLRKSIDCPCFIDINIRPPHFTLTGIEELLTGADHLKLNEHELRILLNQPEENGDSFDWRMMRQMVESLAEQ